jgi:C-terminal processing protease CtpA/Prc
VSSGAFASAETQGNIGAAILEKFTVVLDYARSRIILEPNARFAERIPLSRTGLSLVSEANDFKTFRVAAVADDSAASESGIRAGDVLAAIDGAPASKWTLSAVRERLATAPESHIVLKRGDRRVEVTLRAGPPM